VCIHTIRHTFPTRRSSDLKPSNNGEQLVANITASQIWTEHPQLKIDISGSEINPALWIENEDYSGQLSFSARAQGRGWLPDEDRSEEHTSELQSRFDIVCR